MNHFKKTITLLSFLLALNFAGVANAAYKKPLDGFGFKPAATIEYQGVSVNGRGQNDDFEHRRIEQQLEDFDNIVLGFNARVHKNLGFNLNWAETSMRNNGIRGFTLIGKAALDIQNINATTVLYFPIPDKNFELFAEIGVSDIQSEIKFTQSNSIPVKQKSHETAMLYGAGLQFAPFDCDLAFRFSFQKYINDLGLVNSDMTTFRGGVVIPF